jgi:hypothetical protein
MAKTAQLILTHGTTDLQVLVRDAHGMLLRAVPEHGKVRAFHEWLLAQIPRPRIAGIPEGFFS